MSFRNVCLLFVLLSLVLAGCGSGAPSDAPLPSETVIPASTLTATDTPPPTRTPLPSITPTYAILHGKVLPTKLSCRFGPGPDYLYKFGILEGTTIEIIGRMEHSIWVLVRALGDSNACWVKGDLVDIDGDYLTVAPADPHIVLAWSSTYGAPGGVKATREGDMVTVSWNFVEISPGNDSEQVPYILETWVCQKGEYVFTALGTYTNHIDVLDEPGCAEPSHARVAAAEKHGYTPWAEVLWPPYDGAGTATP